MVVEGGEPRSEWYAGDIVLDEAVDIDDGNGVAELDAGHQYEYQGDCRVHRLVRRNRHRRERVELISRVFGGS